MLPSPLQRTAFRQFKVRTLNAEELRLAAEHLAEMAQAFQPDVLIGIRTGGWVVAELMARTLPQAALLPVTCRRQSTEKKQNSSMLKSLLLKLPYAVTDRLRIAEHVLLTQLRRPSEAGQRFLDTDEMTEVGKTLRSHGGAAKILIVDDAVDSGVTLRTVYDAIRDIAGASAAIKIAAVTVTTDAPLMQPDFSLYRYVLCRFPWSLDFRN